MSLGIGLALTTALSSSASGLLAYSVNGAEPAFVADVANGLYAVDGATVGGLSAAATFARSGTANYFDSSLDLQTAADGVARDVAYYFHDATAAWNNHNKVTYSDDFENAAWTKTNGTVSGRTFTENTATGVHRLQSASMTGFVAGVDYTAEIFVPTQSGSRNIFFQAIGTFGVGVNFNPNTGSINNTTGGTSSVEAVTGGYVLRITGTADGGDGSVFIQANTNTATADESYLGNGSSGFICGEVTVYRADLNGVVGGSTDGASEFYAATTASPIAEALDQASCYPHPELLLEPAATNLVLNSNNLAAATWTNSNSSDATTDSNYTTLTPTGSNSQIFSDIIALSGSTQYTASVMMRENGARYGYIQINSSGGTLRAMSLFMDFHTGATQINSEVSAFSVRSASIKRMSANEWRLAFTFTTDAGHTGCRMFIGAGSSLSAKASAGGDTVDVKYAQLETGPVPTSPIVTTSTAGTRNADSLTVPLANSPATTGGVTIALAGSQNSSGNTLLNWEADANNNIIVASGASDFTFTQEAAGTVDSVTGGSFTAGQNTRFRLASSHSASRINGAVDGVALTENATVSAIADLDGAAISIAPGEPITLRHLLIWESALNDTDMATASTLDP